MFTIANRFDISKIKHFRFGVLFTIMWTLWFNFCATYLTHNVWILLSWTIFNTSQFHKNSFFKTKQRYQIYRFQSFVSVICYLIHIKIDLLLVTFIFVRTHTSRSKIQLQNHKHPVYCFFIHSFEFNSPKKQFFWVKHIFTVISNYVCEFNTH